MYSIKMRASYQQNHISGGETMCEAENIAATIQRFFEKGFYHENGEVDFLNLKIEKITQPLTHLHSLVRHNEVKTNLEDIVAQSNVSSLALKKGLSYIFNDVLYTGAIILSAQSGKRLDTTGQRGVRVTNFSFPSIHSSELSERIKDAISIATCTTHFKGVYGELCVSDDVHYTTGYYATKQLGYHRIFNIKEAGTRHGGRIIFVDDNLNMSDYIHFLECTPKRIFA